MDEVTSGKTTRKLRETTKLVLVASDEDADYIRKLSPGDGGYQRFQTRVQGMLDGNILVLREPSDIERYIRYGTRYGPGGFQDRLGFREVRRRGSRED